MSMTRVFASQKILRLGRFFYLFCVIRITSGSYTALIESARSRCKLLLHDRYLPQLLPLLELLHLVLLRPWTFLMFLYHKFALLLLEQLPLNSIASRATSFPCMRA